jgi:radical SAM superfamily enzyme YgiQ (UPF0313 family)
MRVCLVNPPRIQPKSWGKPSVFQPMDIAYIAGLLEIEHSVQVIDSANEGWNILEEVEGVKYRQGLGNAEIESRLRRYSPDVVGIAIPFSGWWKPASQVAAIVKGIDKGVTTVLSGLHPSARPADCLEDRNVDFVVLGEPEQTVLELVSSLEKGNAARLGDVKGIGYVKEGKMVMNDPRPAIQDLDSLPYPARHLLPMSTYFEAVKKNALRGEVRKPWAVMITSRGCPNNCVFCSIHVVNGKKWRSRSPENVVDELEQVVRQYGVKQVDFNDDNMTSDKKRMAAICDLIVARGLDIEWFTPNGVRADTLDEPLLRKMKASGCRKLRIAPESGVQRVLDQVVKKNLKLSDVEKAVVLSKKVGIKVGCFFVMGLIGETKEDIEGTIRYAYRLRQLGAESFIFSIATPLYGTELYEQAFSGGFLRGNFSDEALSAAEPLIETPEFTADELRELCARANLVNPFFTREKLVKALRDPKKAVQVLFGRM